MSDNTLIMEIGGHTWTATGAGQAYLDVLDEIIDAIEEDADSFDMEPQKYWHKLINTDTGLLWITREAQKLIKRHSARLIAVYMTPEQQMTTEQRAEFMAQHLKWGQREDIINHFLAGSDGRSLLQAVTRTWNQTMTIRTDPALLGSFKSKFEERLESWRSSADAIPETSVNGD